MASAQSMSYPSEPLARHSGIAKGKKRQCFNSSFA
jgi:hypothetical protein